MQFMSKDKKKEEKEKQTTAEAVEETKQPADEIAAEEKAADDGADTKQADNQNVQQPDATAQAEAAAAEMKSTYVSRLILPISRSGLLQKSSRFLKSSKWMSFRTSCR
jgi:type IV secretory pathway VirB10-like protein